MSYLTSSAAAFKSMSCRLSGSARSPPLLLCKRGNGGRGLCGSARGSCLLLRRLKKLQLQEVWATSQFSQLAELSSAPAALSILLDVISLSALQRSCSSVCWALQHSEMSEARACLLLKQARDFKSLKKLYLEYHA